MIALAGPLSRYSVPHGWRVEPFGRITERRRDAGRPDLEPLSVFLHEGVVPRASREDNFNRLGADLGKYLVVQPGDIVFNKLRTWQGGLGISRHHGIVSPAYFVCRPRDSVEPRFLDYLLRSSLYLNELTRISKWMPPSQFDISWDDLKLLPTLLPPLPIQQSLADFLDAETARIDALIGKKRRMGHLLEEERTAVLLGEVAPQLTPSGRTPYGWTRTRLKYLFHRPVAGVWGEEPDGGPLDTLCVRVADFDRRRFRVDERAATFRCVEPSARYKCSVQPGDVLIEKSGGGDAQPVGFPVVFDLASDAVCSNFVARLRPASEIEPAFAGLVLASAYRAGCNVPFVKQTTGIQNIDLPGYLSLSWQVPPRRDQVEICRRLESSFATIDRAIDTLSDQIEILRERRLAVITGAVTGALDLGEAA